MSAGLGFPSCGKAPGCFRVSRDTEYFFEVFNFLHLVFLLCAEHHAAMMKCSDDSQFVLKWLIAVKLEVLVGVCGLSVYREGQLSFLVASREGV